MDDLFEQRVVRRLLGHDLVVELKLLLENGVRRLVELDVVLGLQLHIVLRVPINRLLGHVGARRVYRVSDDGLEFIWQGIVLGLVEGDLELFRVLVVALEHAHLGNIREAERAVRGGVVEFGRIKQATVHGRHDLAAGQSIHRGAHGLKQVDRNTYGTVFQAPEILWLRNWPLEPAERLRRHRPVREGDDVCADRGVELGEKLLAAAILVPGEQHVGIHRVGRA